MNQDQNKQSAKKVLWFFVIFFSTFITVDIAYITVAEKTWRGLATEDGYQKGLKYNQTIEAAKKQEKLGWKMQIKYHVLSSKNGTLEVILTDKNGNQIKDAKVVANITRSVQEGFDFSTTLLFNNKTSSYQSTINFPLIGQWAIDVAAQKGDDIYRDGKRMVIR